MRELMGAILVGGRSTRMGQDKSRVTLPDGRRMLELVANALRETCDEVALVIGRDQDATVVDSTGSRFPLVRDVRADAGPLGGIEALLRSGLAREYIVCPCDLPLLNAAALTPLLQQRDAPATAMRLRAAADFEPLPARVSDSALPVVSKLLDEGRRSVWGLMQSLPAAIVAVDDCLAGALRNINTPDDLSTL